MTSTAATAWKIGRVCRRDPPGDPDGRRPHFVVGMRINGAEYGIQGGLTPEESQQMRPDPGAGRRDYLNVTSLGVRTLQPYHLSGADPVFRNRRWTWPKR